MSTLDHMLEPESGMVRRLEVITGTGRRRRFSDDFRARVIEETLAPGVVISAVARRHGLTPQQVFTWRRQARISASGYSDQKTAGFVPAVVDAPAHRRRGPRRVCKADGLSGVVELTIEGVIVRVGRGADAKTIAAVLRALKAGT